jgi:hypothetical protein
MKPLLKDKMKAKRIKFTPAYQYFTDEDWLNVMCSDKLTFKCLRATRAKGQGWKAPTYKTARIP